MDSYSEYVTQADWIPKSTLPKFNMEPENGTQE